MELSVQLDLGRIAQDLQIRRVQVENVVGMLDEGNTIPFITRYRKERTGNLNEVAIREIQARVKRVRELIERKQTILKSIEAQGKLTEELALAIRNAENPKRLEDLYLPYKPKKRTRASDARDRGLEPLATAIMAGDSTVADLNAAAEPYVNVEKQLDSIEKVLAGAADILAEVVHETAAIREEVRRLCWRGGKLTTSKSEKLPDGQGLDYRDYFQHSEPVSHIPPHRVMAINRGEKEGPLKVKIEAPREQIEQCVLTLLKVNDHPHGEFLRKVAADAIDRLLLPGLEREIRRDLTEAAERHAVDVFACNLRGLLLQPPITPQTILAIDPGQRTGCKVAVLDGQGNPLEHAVVYPHAPQNRRHDAKITLKDLIGKHSVSVVAIGNGTACRETEELIAEIIAEGTHFHENPSAPFPTAVEQSVGSARQANESAPSVGDQGSVLDVPAAAIAAAASFEAGEETSEASHVHAAFVGESRASDVAPNESTGSGSVASDASESTSTASSIDCENPPPVSGGSEEASAVSGEGTESEGTNAVDHSAIASNGSQESVQANDAEPAVEPAASSTDAVAVDASSQEAVAIDHAASVHQEGLEGASVSGENTPDSSEIAASAEGANAVAEASVVEPSAGDSARGSTESKGASPSVVPPKSTPRPPKVKTPPPPPPPPAPHPADAQLAKLAYVIVNEAGASVYSASVVGREEFPDLDASARGVVSIGRRLLDPLAELVKIEPQSIGVGLYQHDVNPKHLKETLDSVIESCVNFVGVNLNTASASLLRYVSGLNQATARRLVEYRAANGAYTGREQMLSIEGIGPATYTQAAGFLKIRDGAVAFDRTWIHPESYGVAERLLERLGYAPDVVSDKERLAELRGKFSDLDFPTLAKESGVGEPTLRDIVDALARPDRDPREDLPQPIFKRGVLKLEDLVEGMELKGTVLNVVDFGAFVDIGLKDSGLVHISQLANRYIKNPHEIISVGDVVTVWVMTVDHERKRVSLTMVKPGTQRFRGGPRGSAEGNRQAQGGERRGGEGSQGGRQDSGRPGRGRDRAPATTAPAGSGGENAAGAQAGRSGRPQPVSAGGEQQRRTDSRPPGRGQDGGGGGGQGRPGGGGRPSGAPGHRTGGPGQGGSDRGGSRYQRGPATGGGAQPQPRPAPRPPKPSAPPKPLSKEALAGDVPLRSFGQLKQLWQARTEEPTEPEAGKATESDKDRSAASASDHRPEPTGDHAPAGEPEIHSNANHDSGAGDRASGEPSAVAAAESIAIDSPAKSVHEHASDEVTT